MEIIDLLQKIKYVKRQSSISINYENLEKEEMERNKNEVEILKDIELSKCLMILAIKKYTWRNELMINFGINKYKAEKFRNIMNELGYITHRLIWEIKDDITYFTMLNQSNMIDQAQMLALTPAGEEWSKKAMDYIAKESNKNQSLMFALQYVLERTQAFRKKYEEIRNLEWKTTKRNITHRIGREVIIEERKTLLGKQREKEIKEAHIELLNRNKEKISSNSNYITEVKNYAITEFNTAEEKKEYNGVYSHLTNQELEEVMTGVSDEEYKQEIKKGYIGSIPEDRKEIDNIYNNLKLILKIKPEEKKKDIFDLLNIH